MQVRKLKAVQNPWHHNQGVGSGSIWHMTQKILKWKNSCPSSMI